MRKIFMERTDKLPRFAFAQSNFCITFTLRIENPCKKVYRL